MTNVERAASRIAMFMVASNAFEKGRWIRSRQELTEADKAEIKAKTAEVVSILKSGNGTSWADILKAIRSISCDSFFIGFKEQDRIIAACAKDGLKFAV